MCMQILLCRVLVKTKTRKTQKKTPSKKKKQQKAPTKTSKRYA